MGVLSTSPITYDGCIEQCLRSMRAAQECLAACLNDPDVNERTQCIEGLQDCAMICSVAVDYMSRKSPFVKDICQLCALICERCAHHCEMHDKDQHCHDCARICRATAEQCLLVTTE